MQVVLRRQRACERPRYLIAPASADEDATLRRLVAIATAHHEEAHRGILFNAVRNALQPTVEPASMQRKKIDGCLRTELGLSCEALHLPAVHPGSEQESLWSPFFLGQRDIAQIGN